MSEKINPTMPIPIVSNPIPDEEREITIAKSNITIPNPIFFHCWFSFPNFDFSHSSASYKREVIFYPYF